MIKKIAWYPMSAWKTKRKAKSMAKHLRAPGPERVRAKVVKEVCYRIYAGVKL